jgi:CHRD domain
VAAHIHVARKGVAGPVVQNLGVDPGAEDGVVRAGTFTNPALLAAIGANPDNYYINVHTDVCPPGVVRGQLGEQGRRRARGSGTTEGTGAPAAWLPSAANHSVSRRRRSSEAKGGTR